ncbi:hypothetical protein AURDEDRAFT_169475 [Auricularia subglabra TFB-10046 SS5]|nr:hypothetical protein AURDEDRAFT_169475 [Auricularia subglabra TFB-10046 SS5]
MARPDETCAFNPLRTLSLLTLLNKDPFFATSSQTRKGTSCDIVRQLGNLASNFKRALGGKKTHQLLADADGSVDLRELHKYGVFFVQRHTDTRLFKVYLFEDMLVLSAPSCTAESSGTEARLEIEGVVRLGDIFDISHHQSIAPDGKARYCLELQVRPALDIHGTWRLFFDDLNKDLMTAWSALLCRLVSQARHPTGFPDFGPPATMGSFAFDPLYRSTRPMPDMSNLHKYAPVTVQGANCSAECSAYLFDDVLLFVYKDTEGVLHVHKRVNLTDIVRISDQSSGSSFSVGVTLFVEADASRTFVSGLDYSTPGRTRLEYVFSVRTRGHVHAWLQALEARVFALRPSPFAAVPPSDDSPSPPEPTWHIAGVVLLTMSTEEAANEYNIGVAVLPQFASDGLATHAVLRVLKTVFETLRVHRVQARVLCTEASAGAVRKFVHLGFTHEGIRMRAAVRATTGEWTDVVVLALLDVDWNIRASVRPPQPSLWEEMLERHQREREQLRVMEGGIKRSRSMETVRDLRALADAAPTPSMVGDDAWSMTASNHTGSHAAGWCTAVPDLECVGGQVGRWRVEQAANADDAADEDSLESWDEIGDEDEDDLYTEEA